MTVDRLSLCTSVVDKDNPRTEIMVMEQPDNPGRTINWQE